MNKTVAKISLVLAALIWGSGFIATQMALDSGITPFYTMFFRFSFASIVLACTFFSMLYKNIRQHFAPGVFLGILMYFAFAFQTIGLQYTSPSKNAFLTATYVLIAPFIFWVMFATKPSVYTFIGASISMLGIGVISINFVEFNMGLGDVLAIVGAFFFACHIVCLGNYTFNHNLKPIVLVIVQMGIAAILSFISGLFFEEYTFVFSFKALGSILYLGIFSTLIGFLLQSYAQKHIPATTTAIILSTESVFGALLSALVLKEQLTIKIMVGGLLVLLAVIIAETQLSFIRKKP